MGEIDLILSSFWPYWINWRNYDLIFLHISLLLCLDCFTEAILGGYLEIICYFLYTSLSIIFWCPILRWASS